MSELNLIPNPQVMLAQALIFASQFYIVNKFLVTPFSKLREKRNQATVGADLRSGELNQEIQTLSEAVQAKLGEAHGVIRSLRETERINAKAQRDGFVQKAQKEMSDLIQLTRKDIESNLLEERKKLDSLTKALVEDMYSKITQ